MNVRNQALHRTERLHPVDHRSDIDKSRALRFRDPSRGRAEGGPSLLSTLRAEVQHAEARLATAQDQLRRWLLSHGSDETPDVGPHGANDDAAIP